MELRHFNTILKILAENLEIVEAQGDVARFERDEARREVEILRKKVAKYEQMFEMEGKNVIK